jgi:hypothetical protein
MSKCLGNGEIVGVSFAVFVGVIGITIVAFRLLNGGGATDGGGGIMFGLFLMGGLVGGVLSSVIVGVTLAFAC